GVMSLGGLLADFSSKLSIDTPENIVLDAEIAGFGSRCIAAMIDYTILIIVMIILTFLFGRSTSSEQQSATTVVAIWLLIMFTLMTFYHLLFELAWNGQTPGKRLTGIRVVQSNGMPLSATGAIVRNLIRI